ncbi:Rrp1p [Ascoidea rubescens DSM 1968]|uniref:Putative ribosomal RNA-processing protein n=1 Tax=Ascoidea rubescens DSM 1968 TaxID=1344418 RepID=A0A1D2VAT2_9ASCO|nr:putative ribosomal RNA-processing protein [Ascoidea rubescens DSM 1968]ODV58699.1 putative ribosomal RNA-processing protein [Ascoidea rubescens DSM 1968]
MSTNTFVKKLAANDRPTREAAFKVLKKYLETAKPLSFVNYQHLWKGLFYSMWFSDKPRPQQRLARLLGDLFSETIPKQSFVKFVGAFWSIIINEWPNIDQWRMDKFYLLLRNVVNSCFKRLKLENYDRSLTVDYLNTLFKNDKKNNKLGPLSGSPKILTSIPYHIIDIYVDELEKVLFQDIDIDDLESRSQIANETSIALLIEPFYDLSKNAIFKPLRVKTIKEILKSPKLIEWGVLKNDENDEENDEDSKNNNGDDIQSHQNETSKNSEDPSPV